MFQASYLLLKAPQQMTGGCSPLQIAFPSRGKGREASTSSTVRFGLCERGLIIEYSVLPLIIISRYCCNVICSFSCLSLTGICRSCKNLNPTNSEITVHALLAKPLGLKLKWDSSFGKMHLVAVRYIFLSTL